MNFQKKKRRKKERKKARKKESKKERKKESIGGWGGTRGALPPYFCRLRYFTLKKYFSANYKTLNFGPRFQENTKLTLIFIFCATSAQKKTFHFFPCLRRSHGATPPFQNFWIRPWKERKKQSGREGEREGRQGEREGGQAGGSEGGQAGRQGEREGRQGECEGRQAGRERGRVGRESVRAGRQAGRERGRVGS